MKPLSVRERTTLAAQRLSDGSAVKTAGSPPALPRTGPGVMAAHLAKESHILVENQQLKDEIKILSEMAAPRLLDPKFVRPSRWANRHADHFLTQAFLLFKEEIKSAGVNTQPIKVRPIPNTEPQEYEIAFGHRRHRACLDEGLMVAAFIESLDDRALFVDMELENRGHENLRPYEQGHMYHFAISEGLYPSIRALAKDIGRQHGNVATAVKLASLPAPVLDAFPSRLDLQYRWAPTLGEAVEKNKDAVFAEAEAIVAERKEGAIINPIQTYKRLTKVLITALVPTLRTILHGGKQVATIKPSKGGYVFAFEKGVLSEKDVSVLEAAISKLLAKG